MSNNSFIAVPLNIDRDPIALKRFLLTLIEQLDIAFGNRGADPFANVSKVGTLESTVQSNTSAIVVLNTNITALENAVVLKIDTSTANALFVKKDGSTAFTSKQSYDTDKTFSDDKELIAKKYADDNFTNNPQQTDPGDLSQTITNPPTQTEVQDISNKIDAVLAELRLANII